MTRLLIVVIDAPFFVTHRMALAVAAKAAGYDVHVAAPIDPTSPRGDRAAQQKITDAGLVFHTIPLRRGSLNPFKEFGVILAVRRLLQRLDPAVMHCVGTKPVVYGGLLTRLFGGPTPVYAVTGLGTVFMGRGKRHRLRQGLMRAGFLNAFRTPGCQIIFQNPVDEEVFFDSGVLKDGQFHMIGGVGANLERFHPRLHDTSPTRPLTIMLAARLIEAKGIRYFVEAARRLKAKHERLRFVLVGHNDPESPTDIGHAEIEGWQQDGLVEWWGHVDDMPATFAQADIFCLPSHYREGVPKVLLEAAAMGLPIVTTDMPGCRDVVIDGESGLLVPPRDESALTQALERLIADAPFRANAASAARALAENRFSESDFVAKSLEIYGKAATFHTHKATRS